MTGAVWTAQGPPPQLVAAPAVVPIPATPSTRQAQDGAGWMRILASFVARMWLYALVWLAAWVLVPTVALGWSPVAISSGSMAPLVQRGDVLLLQPGGKALEAGRIATFQGARGLVSHRVVEVMHDGSYRTRGDANTAVDSDLVLPAQVQGAARIVVPMIGLPSRWLAEGRWLPLALVVAVTGVAILAAPLREGRTPSRRRSLRVLRDAGQLSVLLVGLALVVPAASAAAWAGATPSPAAWTADVIQAPTGVSAAYTCVPLSLLDSVKVQWTASTSTVDGYRILRSVDGGALQVQANLVAGTSWTDTSVSSNRTYRYVVRSVAGSWVSADTGNNETTITTPSSLCL